MEVTKMRKNQGNGGVFQSENKKSSLCPKLSTSISILFTHMLNVFIFLLIFGIIGVSQLDISNLSPQNRANKFYGKLPPNLCENSHSTLSEAMLRGKGVFDLVLQKVEAASSSRTEIDPSAATVVATVAVGTGSIGVGVNPNTNQIYVANRDSKN